MYFRAQSVLIIVLHLPIVNVDAIHFNCFMLSFRII